MQEDQITKNGRAGNQSKEYWHDIIQEWQASNESQKQFCTRKGIKLGTFSHWRTEFLAKTKLQPQNKFVSLVLKSTEIPDISMKTVIVENKNGNKIYIPLSLSNDELKGLFSLLGFCHA